MTLEQTTRLLRAAAEALDLEALAQAKRERIEAIAALRTLPPSEDLRAAVAESIAAGEEATRALRRIKQRIRQESRRLAVIEAGFLRSPLPGGRHIDCKG